MPEVQNVPNSVKNWEEAAREIWRRKCKIEPSKEEVNRYAARLEEANPGKSPAASDLRWWPRLHHLLGEDIVFAGPDPECPPEDKECPRLECPSREMEVLDLSSVGTKPERTAPPITKKPVKPLGEGKEEKEIKEKIELLAKKSESLAKKLSEIGLEKDASSLLSIAYEAKSKPTDENFKKLNTEYEKSKGKYNQLAKDYGMEEIK